MNIIPKNIFYKIQKEKNQEEERIFELNEYQKLSIMVIDDFYENPIKVRENAIEHDIKKIQNEIQKCIEPFGQIGEFSNIPPLDLCKMNPGGEHNSESVDNKYLAIIYLTQHTLLRKITLYKSNIEFDTIENKFNRIIFTLRLF